MSRVPSALPFATTHHCRLASNLDWQLRSRTPRAAAAELESAIERAEDHGLTDDDDSYCYAKIVLGGMRNAEAAAQALHDAVASGDTVLIEQRLDECVQCPCGDGKPNEIAKYVAGALDAGRTAVALAKVANEREAMLEEQLDDTDLQEEQLLQLEHAAASVGRFRHLRSTASDMLRRADARLWESRREALRGMWEFGAVAHFMHVVALNEAATPFTMPLCSSTDLERMLLNPDDHDVTKPPLQSRRRAEASGMGVWAARGTSTRAGGGGEMRCCAGLSRLARPQTRIRALHSTMMRLMTPSKKQAVSDESWLAVLYKWLAARRAGGEVFSPPLVAWLEAQRKDEALLPSTEIDYDSMALEARVHVLHLLCHGVVEGQPKLQKLVSEDREPWALAPALRAPHPLRSKRHGPPATRELLFYYFADSAGSCLLAKHWMETARPEHLPPAAARGGSCPRYATCADG